MKLCVLGHKMTPEGKMPHGLCESLRNLELFLWGWRATEDSKMWEGYE